jgi:uncharacterized membrane protein
VVSTAAALSLAFASPENQASVIVIVSLLVLVFLFIEARRYRYYELFAYRVRLMETNYFAEMLHQPFRPSRESAESLAQHLRRPSFTISLLEAFGRRYRRNYGMILLVLALAWLVKVVIHPTAAADWDTVVERASIGGLSGWWVIMFGVILNGLLLAVGILSAGMRETTGEVFAGTREGRPPFWQRFKLGVRRTLWEILETDIPTIRMPLVRPRRQLVFIISDAWEKIGEVLLSELDRGVTLLHGTGMYTGKEHGILMCAVTAGQIGNLQHLVHGIDEHAFVMVTPLQDVRGEGFRPLEA